MRAFGIILAAIFALGLSWGALRFGNELFIELEEDGPSISHGSSKDGFLENGKRLPSAGKNFQAYSQLGTLLGRNSVHHQLRDAVVESYEAIALSHPDLVFVYGESGWPSGGQFRPHKTHRNGLSVDFMVPVHDELNTSLALPTDILHKFGYSIEFNGEGRWKELTIDFKAMAIHLQALRVAAANHGLRISRVIFAPELQPKLLGTLDGRRVRRVLNFSKAASWVRHDEHYHVDFELVDAQSR